MSSRNGAPRERSHLPLFSYMPLSLDPLSAALIYGCGVSGGNSPPGIQRYIRHFLILRCKGKAFCISAFGLVSKVPFFCIFCDKKIIFYCTARVNILYQCFGLISKVPFFFLVFFSSLFSFIYCTANILFQCLGLFPSCFFLSVFKKGFLISYSTARVMRIVCLRLASKVRFCICKLSCKGNVSCVLGACFQKQFCKVI